MSQLINLHLDKGLACFDAIRVASLNTREAALQYMTRTNHRRLLLRHAANTSDVVLPVPCEACASGLMCDNECTWRGRTRSCSS